MSKPQDHTLRIHSSRSDLLIRRDRLVDQISHVFKEVHLDGGTSLSEAHAIDNYGSEEECAAARLLDKDTPWSQVDVEQMDPGGSCLSFVDPIGYRFYIPAYMTYSLQNAYGPLLGEPSVDSNVFDHLIYGLDASGYGSKEICDNVREKYSLLTHKEHVCIARFLAFDAELMTCDIFGHTLEALKNEWGQYLPHLERKHLVSIWPKVFD